MYEYTNSMMYVNVCQCMITQIYRNHRVLRIPWQLLESRRVTSLNLKTSVFQCRDTQVDEKWRVQSSRWLLFDSRINTSLNKIGCMYMYRS